jgi:chromosome partitioning protein
VRTIAIINQKGGCGKTTTSINLAAVLAMRGHRTLLVDVDPQSHCALGLAVPEAQIERSIADLLRHGLDGTMSLDDITWQISRGLDLAPSAMGLAALEQQLAAAPDRDRRLAQVLSPAQDRYDFCIIDCPPSIGLLTFNALRAADEVLIPVETGYFAMQGAVRQERTIEMMVRRVGHSVRFRVLPTMYDVRTKLAREILGELKKHFGEKVLPIVINFNSKLKEAASFGQPITEYDGASRGMQDFEQLAGWLLENPPRRTEALPTVQDDAEDQTPAASPETSPVVTAAAAGTVPATPTRRPTPPALSRAAELVERARALSAKTAESTTRTTAAPTPTERHHASPCRTAPASAEPVESAPAAATMAPAAAPQTVTIKPSLPIPNPAGGILKPIANKPAGDPAATQELKEKVAKLYGVRHTSRGVLFIQPANNQGNLAIAGDFNNWNPSQTPMHRDEQLGVYQACVQVPVGRYRYRLVRDGQWVQDPFNKETETNPFGELNNIVEVA